jgi:hypothetical protein
MGSRKGVRAAAAGARTQERLHAGVAELVDALDSKSSSGDRVPVRFRPPAPPSRLSLPRLGPRVRMPSPAPISLNHFRKLRAALRGRCCLEVLQGCSLRADSMRQEENCGIYSAHVTTRILWADDAKIVGDRITFSFPRKRPVGSLGNGLCLRRSRQRHFGRKETRHRHCEIRARQLPRRQETRKNPAAGETTPEPAASLCSNWNEAPCTIAYRTSARRSACSRASAPQHRAGAGAQSSDLDPRSFPSIARSSRRYAPPRKAR